MNHTNLLIMIPVHEIVQRYIDFTSFVIELFLFMDEEINYKQFVM